MPDMLVRLYDVKPCDDLIRSLRKEGIYIKRLMAPDMPKLVEYFGGLGGGWCAEAIKAALQVPSKCFVAVKGKEKVIGFAAYESTHKAFFGPTSVSEEYRGKGIGKALLIMSLLGLKELGYQYGIIGGAAGTAVKFYEKVCDAQLIGGDIPGAYRDLINHWEWDESMIED